MNNDIEYKVVVSDKAKRMLGMHIRFIAQVNSNSAKEQKKKLMTALRSLAHFTQRFPFFDEIYVPKNKYHKMYVEKRYIVLYQIQDNTVYVDYILDCRKDYSWLIQ